MWSCSRASSISSAIRLAAIHYSNIMTPDDLLANLNHWRFGKCPEYLSAYLSKENAEFWTQAAIDLNKKSIAAWYQIAQDFKRKTIYYTSEALVGFGARPGDRITTPLYSLAVVLEKMPKDHHILIVSSYPVTTTPYRPDDSMNNNWRVRDDDSITESSTASDVIPDKPSQLRGVNCYSIVTTKQESILAKDEKTSRIDRPDDSINNNWRVSRDSVTASSRASNVFPAKPSRPRWCHRTVEKRIRPLLYTYRNFGKRIDKIEVYNKNI